MKWYLPVKVRDVAPKPVMVPVPDFGRGASESPLVTIKEPVTWGTPPTSTPAPCNFKVMVSPPLVTVIVDEKEPVVVGPQAFMLIVAVAVNVAPDKIPLPVTNPEILCIRVTTQVPIIEVGGELVPTKVSVDVVGGSA